MLVDVDLGEAPVLVPASPKEMISVSRENGRTKVRINSSSLTVIQECMRKAQLLLHQKWKAPDESPATLFGSAVHKALEVYYTGDPKDREVPPLNFLEQMSYGHSVAGEKENLCMRSFRAFADKAKLLSVLPEHDKRSLQSGAWILWNYFRAFKDDPFVAYVDKEGPFVERTFSLVIYESHDLTIEVFGTIDVVFQHTQTGELIPCDHKTTSMFGFGGNSYFDREKPNHQYTCYALGAREVFGIKANDFMVNMIEVKARPKTTRGSAPSFPRQLTSRNEDDFKEFYSAVRDAAYRYLYAEGLAEWPQGPVSVCNSYGGCPYRQVCAAPLSLRENILNAKFNHEGIKQ